jgi:hypothetical protein
VERHSATSSREAFLADLHRILPRLYSAALSLPDTGILFPKPPDKGDSDRELPSHDGDRRTTDQYFALARSLGALLGQHDAYREVFNPYDPPTEPEVVGTLSDDIADIYRDLLSGLAHWQRGETGEALWEWRFNFTIHWGEHLTGALRALHALAANYELRWPEAEPGAA